MGKYDKGFIKRKKRVRGKILGTKDRPRLTVFRSNSYIYTQIIDDEAGKTLVFASSLLLKKNKEESKIDIAFKVGENLSKQAKDKKIKDVVFDRRGYRYHGRVKALAEGARKGGLNF